MNRLYHRQFWKLQKFEQVSQKAKEISVGFPVFVMARDLSNPVSREKYSKVFKKLKRHLANAPQILSPQYSGLIQFDNIAPTVEVAFFPAYKISCEELHDIVKSTVYIRGKKTKQEMFRLNTHGIII